MKWNTRFTSIFPCRLPIMGAPMAGVSNAKLAFETCRAGGLGFLAAGYLDSQAALDSLEKEIQSFKKLSAGNFPLCIGFISHITFANDTGKQMFQDLLAKHKPEVVQFFPVGVPVDSTVLQSSGIIQLAHSHGCKVIAQVGTVAEAETVLEAGVDGVCAQGTDAGGHGIRRELGSGTLSLAAKVAQTAAAKDVPVLAAGGITDGRDVAAALAAGADGAVLGTRLWASADSSGPSAFKDALVAAKSGDEVVRTETFDVLWNSYRKAKWPVPYDTSGTLRNAFTDEWDTKIPELKTSLNTPDGLDLVERFKKSKDESNIDLGCVFSGKGVGKITSIEPAFDIVTRIEKETLDAISKVQSVLPAASAL